jgi:hypothetical protein
MANCPARAALFGRLERKDDRASLRLTREGARGTKPNRHMSVMAARVHDARTRRPVLHVVFFVDGQRILISARSITVRPASGPRSTPTTPPDAGPDFEVEAAEPFGDERSRFDFLEA